ncbi:ubiquitin carboxyl-terminal hydrolase 8 isoform X1 [Drosophila pseudoobscura]|uniref:Ubiquitin carboxyl-terminal hydrolase n=1 Tax=Drosophila pseudoobscura pseudoobscura TaxID=46245 RepID=A0A6I8URX9_DROPS|nr:ubiquitin carboxyl-terminal hydrolase 8 isoform X1 [Drosophila pseudoobscura]
MSQLKKLHMTNSLSSLEKLSDITKDLRNINIKLLLSTARKLFMKAEQYRLEGDEEMAYINYMKYFNIIKAIRSKPDYTTHKVQVRESLGDTEANRRIMDSLEMIADSLCERYRQLHKPPSPAAPLNQTETISHSKPQGAASPHATEYARLGVVSCEELYQRISEKSVLVMDCRPSADYERSHLTYFCAFNVPEELITPGMSAGKLQARLSSTAKASWASRSVKESVVLMDWNSKDAQPAANTPIATLLDILKNWDPDVTYRAPIQIVDGGYEYFIMMYPTHCTNPSVQAPKQNNNDMETIDDIEYPSINDISMKEDISPRDFSPRPDINRASKQAALRTYQQAKPIAEIMREQAEFLQRAQQNDEQLNSAAKMWKLLIQRKSPSSNFSESDNQLLYKILQLESQAEDYKIENNRLRNDVERLKTFQTVAPQQVTPKDAEATRRIELGILERQRLDEQNMRERQEREHQLAIAREAKKHYRSPSPPPSPPEESSPQDEVSLSLNKPATNGVHDLDLSIKEILDEKPMFDRATKPTASPRNVERIVSRARDFSPVIGHNVGRGLTGLKNLGNTCYMNSILQCLSNTPQLTEYCLSDKYKNYISRSNKTNGQVIEEVAALIKELWNGQYKCVASRDLRSVVGQYQNIFRGVDQQDSHEFLTILMDWLHSDLQTLDVSRMRETIGAAEQAWLDFTKAKESIILHLFYGQMKSTVKCVTCNKESATYECFSNLSLELPPNANECQLNQCMDMYFSGERIQGWNCPNCKTKRAAIKKLDISKLPPVLVVHLKRFYADTSNTGSYAKKQNFLSFPLQNLEMSPYIARAESRAAKPKTYQLYAVSNHYGTMEGGHYTAFCKSPNYGRWYKFDDQVVSTLDTSNVISSAAYILFYTWLPPDTHARCFDDV